MEHLALLCLPVVFTEGDVRGKGGTSCLVVFALLCLLKEMSEEKVEHLALLCSPCCVKGRRCQRKRWNSLLC